MASITCLKDSLFSSATCYGLPDIARHVIYRTLNPRFGSQVASYDVAPPRYLPHFEPSFRDSNGFL